MTRQQRRKLERQAIKGAQPDWQPLQEVDRKALQLVGDYAAVARRLGISEAEARAGAATRYEGVRLFVNSTYEVTMKQAEMNGWVHLEIWRRDGGFVGDWNDKQRIKGQLVGEECEGLELYPAESRLLNIANVYHLWVNADPSFRLTLGFHAGRQLADPDA